MHSFLMKNSFFFQNSGANFDLRVNSFSENLKLKNLKS